MGMPWHRQVIPLSYTAPPFVGGSGRPTEGVHQAGARPQGNEETTAKVQRLVLANHPPGIINAGWALPGPVRAADGLGSLLPGVLRISEVWGAHSSSRSRLQPRPASHTPGHCGG